jgi:hypothetical protein
MAKDRLDGTVSSNALYEFYAFPGRVLLWLQYMNPKGGMAGVAKSKRRANSPIMTFLYATAFWALAGFVAYAHFFGEK